MRVKKIVRPDVKGRVSLGVLPKDISGFKLSIDKQGRYILDPLAEIPAREKWVFENPKVLAKLEKGLQDSAKGKIRKMDFSKYAEE